MIETPTPESPAERGGTDAIPIVEAIGVSKRYRATVALSDARLRVLPASRMRWSGATAPASRLSSES
jgi:hypothetical protein